MGFIAQGSILALLTVALFGMMMFMLSIPGDPGRGGTPPRGAIGLMFGIMLLVYVAMTIPPFVAAYALRKKKHWARMASIVAGAISAMNVPIGTAACVYAMWFFLGENWKEVYPEVAFEKENKAHALQLQHERETRWTGRHTNEQGEITFTRAEPPDWR